MAAASCVAEDRHQFRRDIWAATSWRGYSEKREREREREREFHNNHADIRALLKMETTHEQISVETSTGISRTSYDKRQQHDAAQT